MKRSSGLFISIITCSGLVWAGEPFYVVRKGDTLSEIAKKYHGAPVYDPQTGALVRLLSMNPDVRDPNLIYPGQRIRVGESAGRSLAASAHPIADIVKKPDSQNIAPEKSVPTSQETEPLEAPVVKLSGESSGKSSGESLPASHLGFDMGFDFFVIDSTDKTTGGTALLLSNASPQARITWDLDWTPEWTSRVRLTFQSEKILDDTDSNRPLQNGSGARYGFEVGGIRQWGSHRTGLLLARSQWIFTRSLDASVVLIDRIDIMEGKLHHESDLIEYKTLRLGLGFDGSVLFPADGQGYSTETGWKSDLSVYLRHRVKGIAINGQVYYGVWKQDSSLVEQSGSRTGVLLGISRELK